jgi:hypothetical protein
MAPKYYFSAGSYLYILFFAALTSAQASCTLSVPANPLTAVGLATPYTVTGCDQRQFADQGSFVEAAIFDPATNTITLYHPLVVNKGDVAGKDFITPIPATVPAGATVGIWFGTNAGTLTLAGPGVGGCVNGLPNSVFGQVSSLVIVFRLHSMLNFIVCILQWRRIHENNVSSSRRGYPYAASSWNGQIWHMRYHQRLPYC